MKKILKAAAVLMLTLTVICTACTKDSDNGGGNGNENTTVLPTGIYLGVIGFNQDLFIKPIAKLDDAAIKETKKFIDGLTLGGATLLYHAVNTSIDNLKLVGIPEDLVNVSIVNFTDGLDKGSYAMNDNYSSGVEYLQAVTKRIRNEKIAGLEIESHTIGIQGNDVYSYDEAEFLDNLNGLSSLPAEKYVHYVTSFSDVQQAFKAIADSLHKVTSNPVLTIKMPVENPNTRVRFTTDVTTSGPDDALNSESYIEGVYITGSDGNGTLTNVKYHGLKSSSGSTVTSKTEGVFAVFRFEGMRDANNNDFDEQSIAHLKEWLHNDNANKWIHNSEFSSSGNVVVNNAYFSSMIMLNLDCSQSLGDEKFSELKTYAKKFINVLNVN